MYDNSDQEIPDDIKQITEPKVTEPKVTEPKVTEPKVAEPKVAEKNTSIATPNPNVILCNLRHLMVARLDKLGFDGDHICTLLAKSHHTCMAGSFPLQVLIGETWGDSDIDYFVNDGEGSDRKYETYKLKNRYYDFTSDLERYFSMTLHNRDYFNKRHTDTKYMTYQHTICGIQNYSAYGQLTQQFIRVKYPITESIQQYIPNTFDLSFCKVMFDGNNFIINGNLQDIYNKIGEISIPKPYSHNLAPRVRKYMDRGFTITNADNLPAYCLPAVETEQDTELETEQGTKQGTKQDTKKQTQITDYLDLTTEPIKTITSVSESVSVSVSDPEPIPEPTPEPNPNQEEIDNGFEIL
jgi:hypothetical protein